jgi:tetratricopeptide (TPR) repeat protein
VNEQQPHHQIQNQGPVQGQIGVNYGPVTMRFDSPTTPAPPESIWMVPHRRNGFFTGRETLLTALHDSFTKDRTAVLTQGQAINGLGGIGKTQIAMEYAHRHRDEYRFVLWASAATHETLISAFVSIADRLQLPERTLQEHDKIVAAVSHWLSTHEDWLLIMDNADELAMVWPLLPTGNKGHVLVTTRDQATVNLESFLVEKMDHVEGTLLLLRRAKILKPGMELEQVSLADRQVAEQIVAEMDGLPLALDQAGAYIEETGCSLAKYLERYQAQRTKLLQRRGRSSHDHPDSVATTWSLSFERVAQNAVAADLLRLCAFLAPDAIPEEIITQGASHLGEHLQSVLEDEGLLDEAIAALGAYSLIRRDPAEKTLSIHRLVQAVIKDSLEDAEKRIWAERTVQAVERSFPDGNNSSNWDTCRRLLPHAQRCAELIAQEESSLSEAATLLLKMAGYLKEMAWYAEAEPLLQQALRIREQQLGPKHLEVAHTLEELGRVCREQGKYAEAEPLLLRALRIKKQQLGPEHLEVAHTLEELAFLNFGQVKNTKVEQLHQRVLRIREQQLGPEHPEVAHTLTNLANLYTLRMGRHEEAKPLFLRALDIEKRRLEPDLPRMAYLFEGLGFLYWWQGERTEAESCFLHSLAIWEQRLEPNHPQIAYPLAALGNLYLQQGKCEKVEPLFLRALDLREQRLGPGHHQTVYTLDLLVSLAQTWETQGNLDKAKPLYTRVLRIREEVLGRHHPKTTETRTRLIALLRAMGRDEEAKQLEEQQ